ncbi:hypothetical protein D9757_007627 [Collybiopsis confluens]|uniref:CENP-C homolog n=1 Tax=Collybiopsis confluens TaxID=2823264 RepID=A0A8H5H9Q4_9AGAR|nr:hypothetical protein D9757_007627 [Collybiopsis confluens]
MASMTSPNEDQHLQPHLEIHTSSLTLVATTEDQLDAESEHEDHEPGTPTSSTSSSTSSFTTVTADLSSSAAELDVNEPPMMSNSNFNSSTVRLSSSLLIEDESAGNSSNETATPPIPPKTVKRKSKTSSPLHVYPEQGWDGNTPTNGNVLDFRTEQPVSRRITHTEKLIAHSMRVAYEGNWSFSKVFSDGSYMASGYIHLPPGGRKSTKNVKDNTYIFHCVEGAVNIKIHDTAYIIAQGGSFMVPRGNIYSIENICDRTAKLMFVQARELTAGEQDDPLRLVRGQPTPQLFPAISKSKLFILLGWIIERLLKRFLKYRKVAWTWYLRTAMQVGRSARGPRAYLGFFVLGFLLRSLGPSRSLLPRVNVQVIRN